MTLFALFGKKTSETVPLHFNHATNWNVADFFFFNIDELVLLETVELLKTSKFLGAPPEPSLHQNVMVSCLSNHVLVEHSSTKFHENLKILVQINKLKGFAAVAFGLVWQYLAVCRDSKPLLCDWHYWVSDNDSSLLMLMLQHVLDFSIFL